MEREGKGERQDELNFFSFTGRAELKGKGRDGLNINKGKGHMGF